MMIKRIKVNNFKTLKLAELELKNLNLFAGMNGMGKSSLLQVLMLLRQSHEQNLLQNDELGLNGSLVNIGLSSDAYAQFGDEETVYFEIETFDGQKAQWTFSAAKALGSRNLYEDEDVLTCISSTVSPDFFDFSLFKEGFQYLSAERVSPQSSFETSTYEVIKRKQLGNHGEFAIHYLALNKDAPLLIPELKHQTVRGDTLLENVEAWLTEISPGISMKTQFYPDMDKVRLAFQYDAGRQIITNEFRPTNVGFGITYILSVIVAILSAKKGDILLVENPEAHLHPRGQSRIGHLMALAAGQGVQLFIETHSDHVLNGIRVAAKKDSEHHVIDADNVSIFFFHREEGQEDHATSIFTPKLDDNGKIDKWLEGFFDEWNRLLCELL
jgi:predicted ATPase